MLEDVLKVLVWSFFAERLVQSALVGWGQSGRVGPVEQVCNLFNPEALPRLLEVVFLILLFDLCLLFRRRPCVCAYSP